MNIAILILAAGGSSRMGEIKQLLPYRNSSMLKHVVSNAVRSDATAVYCILGAHSAEIERKTDLRNVNIIYNPEWSHGLGSSIAEGVSHMLSLNDIPDAILILLADQPFVDSNYINRIIRSYKRENTIIASRYKDRNGVPAIFPKSFFNKLIQMKGDKGARDLLNNMGVIALSGNDKRILKDIDTPEDYADLSADI